MTQTEINALADRYLEIVEWARKRYTIKHRLVLSIGNRLSRYSKIERMAFDRYLRAATSR